MADEKARFLELTRMKYVDQAKWFLNGFWTEGVSDDPEKVWKFAQKFMELDQKKKEGNELDEFWSHKFLESLGETLTVIQLRETLRQVDLDANGKMALLEYLLFRYKKSVRACINSPQGDNAAEIQEASDKLQAVQDALAELQTQLEEQKRALEEQKKTAAEAKRLLEASKRAATEAATALAASQKSAAAAQSALDSQRAAEEAVRRSEAELRAAVDDLKSQEDAYQSQLKELERKSQDSSASTVAKSKAANELAQLKGENPLPLRKAKITQEAALRKVEKERKAAEAATAAANDLARAAHSAAEVAQQASNSAKEAQQDAEAGAQAAEEAAREAERQAQQVEAAVRDTEERYREAQEYLESVKQKGGVAHGSIWWMEREMKEMQKYLPQKKQQK